MAAALEKPASIKLPGKPTEEAPGAEAKPLAPKKKMSLKTTFMIGAGVFFVFTLVLTTLVKRGTSGPTPGPKPPAAIIPTPTMVPRPSVPPVTIGDPTIYNTDPQILQLEGALKTFERQLESLDFREQDLDPPELFMDVNFRTK